VSAGSDLAKSFELADAVIHVDDGSRRALVPAKSPRNGGANFAAGAFDVGGYVE